VAFFSDSHTQDKTKEAAEKELENLTEQNRQLEADKRKMEERQAHLEKVC
jgi:cell division protein FtsB